MALNMNILHINQSDISGGAAISAYRLHQGLLAQGVHSRVLAGIVKTSSQHVAPVPKPSAIEKLLVHFTWHFGLNHLHLRSTWKIRQHPFYQEADLLNLHNLHTGYFNYLAIPALTRNKPTIFILRDMWSFTGHCAYSYDCRRWQTGCGKCPYPDEPPMIKKDTTRLEWKLKKWVYSRSTLTIVALSWWLAEQAKHSMLSRFPIYHIPNGIDTETYKPLDPERCRSILGIPNGKYVLMFAAHILTDFRKGGDLLIKALQGLPASLKAEILLLILGEGGEAIAEAAGIPALNLGYVGSDHFKVIAYSAADLFLLPTRADNLPVVLLESMACGTPMVSFNIGGVPELVLPGVTGYLAKPEDSEDFRKGIIQLVEDRALRERMGQECRTITLNEYRLELQAQRYIELYQKIG